MPQLHATIAGSGPTLVLLHGYLSSSHYFERSIDQLSQSHTVVSVDLLGHGHSIKDKAIEYSFDAQAQALHETLATLKLSGPYTLLGHSMGTLVALRYAQTYPDKVSKLLLLNPPMFRSREQAFVSITDTGRLYRAMLFSRYRRGLWQLFRVARPLPLRRPSIGLRDMSIVPTHARDEMIAAIMESDFFDEIEQITVPTLVIVGQRDRRAYHENLAAWIPPTHVQLRHNPHGHHGLIHQPEIIMQEINQFLSTKTDAPDKTPLL